MFRHTLVRQYEERKFLAAIHGIEVEEKEDSSGMKRNTPKAEQEVLFKDPKEYEGMTQEEKEEITKNMMGKIPSLFKGKF